MYVFVRLPKVTVRMVVQHVIRLGRRVGGFCTPCIRRVKQDFILHYPPQRGVLTLLAMGMFVFGRRVAALRGMGQRDDLRAVNAWAIWSSGGDAEIRWLTRKGEGPHTGARM